MLLIFAAIFILISCAVALAETPAITATNPLYEAIWAKECDGPGETHEFVLPDGRILISQNCYAAAYNVADVWYIYDSSTSTAQPLYLPVPVLAIEYQNDDSNQAVTRLDVTGFTTSGILVNSWYDEEQATISEFVKWRGVGDASTSATWQYHDGQFVLTNYAVDASYDSEVNPVTLIDYGSPD